RLGRSKAMTEFLHWLAFLIVVGVAPPVCVGIIRKEKARLQNRIGASVFQPLFDLNKLYRKGETVSEVTSWIFRSSAAINFALVLIIALLVPWVQFKPHLAGADIFLVIYLFPFLRLMTVFARPL